MAGSLFLLPLASLRVFTRAAAGHGVGMNSTCRPSLWPGTLVMCTSDTIAGVVSSVRIVGAGWEAADTAALAKLMKQSLQLTQVAPVVKGS